MTLPASPRDDITVSCLMVTLGVPGRFPFVQRSIAAYAAQTHEKRELVIIVSGGIPDGRAALLKYVASLGRNDIRYAEAPDLLSLGALRNLSRNVASGPVHCQWDDDDLHHPERIERQLAALNGSAAPATCLQEVMQYFPASRTLYCTNWRATEGTVHPGTLMCRASAPIRYPEDGPQARLGEDSEILRQLNEQGAMHRLAEEPHLYVYVSHGANAWNDGHHRMLADRLAVSKGILTRRETQLRCGLGAFDFGPEPVAVQGSNGTAFTLEAQIRRQARG